jgi:hypothetical protein
MTPSGAMLYHSLRGWRLAKCSIPNLKVNLLVSQHPLTEIKKKKKTKFN